MDISPTTREAVYQALRGDHALNFAGGSLGTSNNRCPFIEKGALAIRWDGDVSPCLALMHDHKMYLYQIREIHKAPCGWKRLESEYRANMEQAGVSHLAQSLAGIQFLSLHSCAADVTISNQTRKTASAVLSPLAAAACGHRESSNALNLP